MGTAVTVILLPGHSQHQAQAVSAGSMLTGHDRVGHGRGWRARQAEGEAEAPVTTMQRWLEAACSELGIDPGTADTRTILDLARDVAHQVDRPAAPLTAYLLGVAVGRGQPLGATAERLTALASDWPPADDPAAPGPKRPSVG